MDRKKAERELMKWLDEIMDHSNNYPSSHSPSRPTHPERHMPENPLFYFEEKIQIEILEGLLPIPPPLHPFCDRDAEYLLVIYKVLDNIKAAKDNGPKSALKNTKKAKATSKPRNNAEIRCNHAQHSVKASWVQCQGMIFPQGPWHEVPKGYCVSYGGIIAVVPKLQFLERSGDLIWVHTTERTKEAMYYHSDEEEKIKGNNE